MPLRGMGELQTMLLVLPLRGTTSLLSLGMIFLLVEFSSAAINFQLCLRDASWCCCKFLLLLLVVGPCQLAMDQDQLGLLTSSDGQEEEPWGKYGV